MVEDHHPRNTRAAIEMAQVNHLYFPECGTFPFSKVYRVHDESPRVLWPPHWWDFLNANNRRQSCCVYRYPFYNQCFERSQFLTANFEIIYDTPFLEMFCYRQYLGGFIDKRSELIKKEYVRIFQMADAPSLVVPSLIYLNHV